MRAKQNIKQLDGCRRLLKIEVGHYEIGIAYDEVYKQFQKEAVLPGFRKGNAPLDLLKADYKDYAKKKVAELLVGDSYTQTIEEAGLLPIGLPAIENIKFPEGGSLSFDAIVEVRPQVLVKNYKGLKVKKKDCQVKDEDVDETIEDLREFQAEYKTIPPRPVQEGDFILCNLEGFVEGSSIGKKEQVLLSIDKRTLTQDVFGDILGSAVGEKKSVSINIDKNFPRQDLSAEAKGGFLLRSFSEGGSALGKAEHLEKSGILEIFVHQIKQKELPRADDEFAKDLGPFEGIEDLRKKIKVQLAFQKQEAAYVDMENQIIGQLLKGYFFELPQSLVDTELKDLLEDGRAKLLQQGYDERQVKEIMAQEKDQMAKRLRLHAENQVKAFFIFQDIADKENLNATEEEVDQLIEQLAKRQKGQPEDFKRQLEKDEKINSLYWQMTEAKVMGFLLDNAKIEEEVVHV